MNIVEARGLGRRFGRRWVLKDVNLCIPAGRVAALVGPNGAGKTTLLHAIVGLSPPTSGELRVLGDASPESPAALNGIAFVAQDTPLYPGLSVRDTLRLVASLSATWDDEDARSRLNQVGIPLGHKVGKLSGGQRTQVALAVALARHPDLLILDEPVSRLDPLARHEFMATLLDAVSQGGLSVVFSSHVVAELERACDYLIVLNEGQVQLIGDVDDLRAGHRMLTGPAEAATAVAQHQVVVRDFGGSRQSRLLVRKARPVLPPGWDSSDVSLEELVLSYLRSPSATALPGPIGRDSRAHTVAGR